MVLRLFAVIASAAAAAVICSTGLAAPLMEPNLAGLVIRMDVPLTPRTDITIPPIPNCPTLTAAFGRPDVVTVRRSAGGYSGSNFISDLVSTYLDPNGTPVGGSGAIFQVTGPGGSYLIAAESSVNSSNICTGNPTTVPLEDNATRVSLGTAYVTVVENANGSYTATVTVPGTGLAVAPPTRTVKTKRVPPCRKGQKPARLHRCRNRAG